MKKLCAPGTSSRRVLAAALPRAGPLGVPRGTRPRQPVDVGGAEVDVDGFNLRAVLSVALLRPCLGWSPIVMWC